ncbi:Putative ribokinase [Yamadazyma tenuis]|uniref:Ribokinase n=1 Tax=Candida tenuis (strain ATCC 10573 / BCRC 21748 / CBS 615 / JCM 9827 / NBRC 10315 / NRRL Y-1498 / VKM Y-70) TaxID=590646 RepID=G3B9X5_CANTC|nr:uncharacterized protein CANTEDRAFT_108947 [Yamadazyma tenuis ATCC 10573]EGV61349.1 hypothetical protein CANTEDRAFT_108947 [Yamadazyma tenuis ATCC 10573]WEJ92563.1 Putative ribokinase [Yamadazyma tenuis]
MSKSITIIGSLNYDLVTYTDKVPEGGETMQANSFENHLGGKGLNEAIAVARLSSKQSTIPVRMIGNIGNDTFGKELKQALVEAGVDTQFIKTIDGVSSGVATILVESQSGENRILITPGANGELKPSYENYETYFPNKNQEGFVILQNEYPNTAESIEWIKTHRSKLNIAWNPSPFKPDLIKSEILSRIDMLIVNEGEALDVAKHLLSSEEIVAFDESIKQDKVKGFGELASKLTKLINPANINLVIITMGGQGSLFSTKNEEPTFEKSVKVTSVVDTTGAGDTFFGGVVVKLASGFSTRDAVKFATKASGIVIQKKGAVESIPLLEDIN